TASYTDADARDTHTFSVNTTGTFGTVTNNGDGTFGYDPSGQFEYLNAGQTATDTFQYTVDDGHGGLSTAVATVTIQGENDAAVVSGTTAGDVTEAGGVNNGTPGVPTASGTLTDSDVDNPADTFQAVTSAAVSDSGYGTFMMTAGGTWTYTL